METFKRYQQPKVNNIEELKRNEWLIWPADLMQTESEWTEQVSKIFASYEVHIPSLGFIMESEEKNAVIQWERFTNLNRLAMQSDSNREK